MNIQNFNSQLRSVSATAMINSISLEKYILLAGPPGTARDYFTISLWKSPVQIDLMDQGKKNRQAVGWVLSGAGLPAYHWGQVKWEAPDKFQENCSKSNTPFGSGLEWAPKIKFYYANPLQGAVFVCWPSQNSKCIYPHLVGWTLRAPCWGEPHTKYNFTNQTYPEEQILFAGLLSILNAYTPFCWVGPCGPRVGVSPHK
jgi:hypothetical protein